MAPFPDDDAVFQDDEPGIASYDGFQCRGVRIAEGIFRTGQFAPPCYCLVAARREADEGVAVVLTVLVYLVYGAEVLIVGMFKTWRYEQEDIVFVRQDFVCDVLARIVYDGEVLYRGTYPSFTVTERLSTKVHVESG